VSTLRFVTAGTFILIIGIIIIIISMGMSLKLLVGNRY